MAADQWQTSSLVWICAHKRNALQVSFLVFTKVHLAQHILSHHCNKCQGQRTQHQHCLYKGRANSTCETLGRTESGREEPYTYTSIFKSTKRTLYYFLAWSLYSIENPQFHLDSFPCWRKHYYSTSSLKNILILFTRA